MTQFFGEYTVYVVSSYAATAAILGWIVWSSLRANARARADLERVERERRS